MTKKAPKFTHTSGAKRGMGDWYGSAIKNKIGRPVDVFHDAPVKAKKMGKSPTKMG